MLTALAQVHLPDDDRVAVLRPGQIIGRSNLGLQVHHPDVSEAHALCSYRAEGLVLLPLRGELRTGGRVRASVPLNEPVSVELAPGVTLEIDAAVPGGKALALRVGAHLLPLPPGYARLMVDDGRASWTVADDEPPELDSLECWSAGEEWFVKHYPRAPEKLRPGLEFRLSGGEIARVEEYDDVPVARTRKPFVLRIGSDRVELRDHDGLRLAFPDEQGALLRLLERHTRDGRTVHRSVLIGSLYTGAYYTTGEGLFRDQGSKNFDRLRKRLVRAIEQEKLPMFLTYPRRGDMHLDREVVQVELVEATGGNEDDRCPHCGRGPLVA